MVKNLPAIEGDLQDVGLDLWVGMVAGEGNGNSFQYSLQY